MLSRGVLLLAGRLGALAALTLACASSPAPHSLLPRRPPPHDLAGPAPTSTDGVDMQPRADGSCVDDGGDVGKGAARKKEQLKRTVPDRDQRFGPILCMADREVWFDDAGRMRVCTVARQVSLAGVVIENGAYTHFFPSGNPEQTTLARAQSLETAAGLTVPCAADFVALSDAGAVEHCKLEQPMTIRGAACRVGESVAFHPGGQLWGATIDQPYQALSVSFPAGTRLRWHPDGSLAGGRLSDPLRVLGHAIRYEFAVHPNGKLAEFTLAAAETIGSYRFPERATIRLRSDGTLQSAEYESDHGFLPHGEPWTDTTHMRFDCAGRLKGSHVEHYQAPSGPEIL